MLDIIKSWSAAINPSDDQLERAEKRMEICDSCEHKVVNLFLSCGVCGCPLKGKVFSDKGCPLGKW